MHEVSDTSLGQNKMPKLRMEQSFAFVLLGSSCIYLPMGPRSIVLVLDLLYTAPWLCILFTAKG
jgi:hypothetical protein